MTAAELFANAVLFFRNLAPGTKSYIPSLVWLWSSVVVDIVITTVLTYNLAIMKRGFNPQTDYMINSLIRLAFESCAVPAVIVTTAAVAYAVALKYPAAGNIVPATLSK